MGADYPSGSKKAAEVWAFFAWKTYMYANLLHRIPSKESLHDETVRPKPTLSDGQLDSGKYRVLCFGHKRSKRCLTQLSLRSGSQIQPSV